MGEDSMVFVCQLKINLTINVQFDILDFYEQFILLYGF